MLLIIGIGNPGKQYNSTRHNIGYVIADRFAFRLGGTSFKFRFNAEYFKTSYIQNDILIVKPLTFMNNSGSSVVRFLNYYKEKIDNILVLHDDLDIDFGYIRFKSGGSSGGHNGLESIIKSIKHDRFDRLRFGIGRPQSSLDPADYVLKNFKKPEVKQLDYLIEKSVEALQEYINHGIEHVMNIYNKRQQQQL